MLTTGSGVPAATAIRDDFLQEDVETIPTQSESYRVGMRRTPLSSDQVSDHTTTVGRRPSAMKESVRSLTS